MFWSKPDSRVMYEIDSEMTNIIEVKMTADSEHMTKYSLEHVHGMTWQYWIWQDWYPSPNATVNGSILGKLKWGKKAQGISRNWRQTYYPSSEYICKQEPCSRVTMYYHNKIQNLSLISPSRTMSASFHFYKFKKGNKHSLYIIKEWVHSHMFYELEKGGVHS